MTAKKTSHQSIVKFADDTAIVECSTKNDDRDHRQEVKQLEIRCRDLCISVMKTKEIIISVAAKPSLHPFTLGEQLWKWSPALCILVHIPLKTLTFSGTP